MNEKFKSSSKTQPEPKSAQANQNWEAVLNQVLSLYKRGVAGDQQAIKKAYEMLVGIRNKSPQENIIEAYLGGILTLMGRDEKSPQEKLRKVMEGLKILDRAVAKESNNINIRLFRAYVCFNLPQEIFHRQSTAVDDFKYIINCYQKDTNVLSTTLYNQVQKDLAVAQKKLS